MKTEVIDPAERYEFFVGIDWGVEAHVVCVLDARRRVILQRSVPHTGTAILELADDVAKLGDVGLIAVAIEMPRGAIIETLIERGFADEQIAQILYGNWMRVFEQVLGR